MVKAMKECGFGAFSFDHEGGDGQVEFDFDFAPCAGHGRSDHLVPAHGQADRQAVRADGHLHAQALHRRLGIRRPLQYEPHRSPSPGQNLFRDPEDHRGRGWSKTAYGFAAGIMRHAPALAAICTPTVNSYKRLQPRLSDGTVSWAPTWAAYGDNNRSCMLRLPRNRPAIENRAVDSAANPYLAAAFLLAAGLEGVAEGLDPGEPIEDLTYDWSKTGPQSGDVQAPTSAPQLLEAIEAFQADPLSRTGVPSRLRIRLHAMKVEEWETLSRPGLGMGTRDLPRDVLMRWTRRRSRTGPVCWEELTWCEIEALVDGHAQRGRAPARRRHRAARTAPAHRHRHDHRHRALSRAVSRARAPSSCLRCPSAAATATAPRCRARCR